jgi:hypothetical protein
MSRPAMAAIFGVVVVFSTVTSPRRRPTRGTSSPIVARGIHSFDAS